MAKRNKEKKMEQKEVKEVSVTKKVSPYVEIESKILMNVVLIHDIYCKANGKCVCKRVKHRQPQIEHVQVGRVKAVDQKYGKAKVVIIPSSYTIVPGRQKVRKALLELPNVKQAIEQGLIKVL